MPNIPDIQITSFRPNGADLLVAVFAYKMPDGTLRFVADTASWAEKHMQDAMLRATSQIAHSLIADIEKAKVETKEDK